MIKATIESRGETLSDLLDAIGEAVRRIDSEFMMGFDRNESSSFHFSVEISPESKSVA